MLHVFSVQPRVALQECQEFVCYQALVWCAEKERGDWNVFCESGDVSFYPNVEHVRPNGKTFIDDFCPF